MVFGSFHSLRDSVGQVIDKQLIQSAVRGFCWVTSDYDQLPHLIPLSGWVSLSNQLLTSWIGKVLPNAMLNSAP